MQRVEDWVRGRYANMLPQTRQGEVDALPTVFCQFHPCAEEVELTLTNQHELIASANTSSVGPGYHVFLTEMLEAWARDFHASWEQPPESSEDYGDETDYFFTRDKIQLSDHMTRWLQALAGTFFDGPFHPDDTGIALCMPMDSGFEVNESAMTPLGPRGRDWLDETSQDGVKGKDFFAWWTPGFNAEYYLGRALSQMWQNVRWRLPVNQAETELLKDVAQSLDAAHRLNPSLSYPWAEWQEVLALLGSHFEQNKFVSARVKEKPAIGYRRNRVSVGLPGGWRIRIPGSFSDFEADEENNLYALDPPREVWFTSYRFTASSPKETFDSTRQRIKGEQPEYLSERDGYIAKASINKKRRESGEEYFVLNSSSVCWHQRAVCTILFSRADEKELALDIWRSIEPPPGREKSDP